MKFSVVSRLSIATPVFSNPLTPGPSPPRGRGEKHAEFTPTPLWRSPISGPIRSDHRTPEIGEGGAQRRVGGPLPPDYVVVCRR
jgi:hypothetical protein